MATLTVATIVEAGITTALVAAAAGGDEFTNNGDTHLDLNNGGGVTCNVTLATTKTVNGKTIADRVVAVLAGTRQRIGPFDGGVFNDTSGKVQITYDQVATVTLEAVNAGTI